MRAELLKGHLDGLLLATVEACPAMAMPSSTSSASPPAAVSTWPTGTLYPALHRLECAGLVTSS
jgi:PadR family transcriptional regulator, regulatory protein PadR